MYHCHLFPAADGIRQNKIPRHGTFRLYHYKAALMNGIRQSISRISAGICQLVGYKSGGYSAAVFSLMVIYGRRIIYISVIVINQHGICRYCPVVYVVPAVISGAGIPFIIACVYCQHFAVCRNIYGICFFMRMTVRCRCVKQKSAQRHFICRIFVKPCSAVLENSAFGCFCVGIFGGKIIYECPLRIAVKNKRSVFCRRL